LLTFSLLLAGIFLRHNRPGTDLIIRVCTGSTRKSKNFPKEKRKRKRWKEKKKVKREEDHHLLVLALTWLGDQVKVEGEGEGDRKGTTGPRLN